MGISYKAMKEETYGMAFFAQCINIAWEFVYGGLVYPPQNPREVLVFVGGLASNLCVQYTSIAHGRREWQHVPFIHRHLGLLYAVTIVALVLGNLAFARQIGPHQAEIYIAIICQVFVSVGCLCQLLVRQSTRGFSMWLWTARHFGSCFAIPVLYLRSTYWPEAFGFAASPTMIWMGATAYLADVTYAVCFSRLAKEEELKRVKRID
ncbi:integral membrane protein [Aspergillus steynii IBT 23096]|uniref:Integral membrane protein n=1 Tax=Aspergillus steynii IBT 23096 TaxID=1392250 RepID=A0A2I2GA15_9EURO|nr:uncharacterized protein P170DRAFT_384918 [Aspergillus steynii IBT 23096]PLB49708.1 integral membrane protein [Aspergillus steynii IBT 23096]